MSLTRRVFLGSFVTVLGGRAVWAGQGGLDAFGSSDPKCAADVIPTPSVPADGSYKPGSPVRTTLTSPGQTGVPLRLTGTVAGVSCGPIAGAELEWWQADDRGRYDVRGFALRGQQRTDDHGRYTLVTIVPGPAPGRASCLGVHVNVPGRAELWTTLFFAGRQENARDLRVKEPLLITLSETAQGRTGTFDIRIDI